MEQKEKEKLLILARRAKEADDAHNAKKYYEELMLEDPNDWEAVFYAQYYTFFSSKVIQAPTQANLMRKAAKNAVNVICDSEMSLDEKVAAVKVLENDMFEFWQHVNSCLVGMSVMDFDEKQSARCSAFAILYDVGDILEEKLSASKEINEICVKFWKEAVLNTISTYDFYYAAKFGEIARQHIPMITKYDPAYLPPEKKVEKKSGGCLG